MMLRRFVVVESSRRSPQRWLSSASKRQVAAHSGLSDFVELWSPQSFRYVGVAMTVGSASLWPLSVSFHDEIGFIGASVATIATALYWNTGLNDMKSSSALRKNFPVLIHARYVLESLRPEIQQYFIQSDQDEEPFSRSARSVVYQRAKQVRDTVSFGTRRSVYGEGHEWVNHTMWPLDASEVETRVKIGGVSCLQPYDASLLNVSAMSFGALSRAAISALNDGAKAGNFYHNTGEGGISKQHLRGADVVWNVGTGYFACGENDEAGARVFSSSMFRENATRPQVKMIEIKLSQGAKPAHGGVLPKSKITDEIAEARQLKDRDHDVLSPPKHSAFQSPAGLVAFVAKLRELSGGKPIGFKLCVGQPAELCALFHAILDKPDDAPDFVTVDGAEGGTGAAPPEFQDSVGMPLAEGLTLTHALLKGTGLRDRVKIIASGKVYDGFSLCRTLAHGADVTNSARAMMFSLGCIQSLKCNTNKCPTGITTQDPRLEAGLDVTTKSVRVANFHKATVHSATEIMASVGAKSPREVDSQHFFRRESGIHVKNFKEMHQCYFAELDDRVLLSETSAEFQAVPEQMKCWWRQGRELHESTKQRNSLHFVD